MALNPSQHSMHDAKSTKMSASRLTYTVAPLGADPELLRWRAEVLLDEMMLGGVDVTAGDKTPSGAWPTVATPSPASVTFTEQSVEDFDVPAPLNDELGHAENGHNGHRQPSLTHQGAPYQDDEAANTKFPPSPGDDVPGPRSGDTRAGAMRTGETRSAHAAAQPPRVTDPEPQATGSSAGGTAHSQAWVASAEERYRRLAARQAGEPDVVPPPVAAGDTVEYSWPEESVATAAVIDRPSGSKPSAGAATVRQAGTVRTGSGTRAAASVKRSNLLPRMSTADVEAIQREIYTLENDVDLKLPVGHESNTRAHHLLEKANEILQADAARSAEVEYYLQQVRTIFQRIQQTIDDSSIYRNRLLVYLTAWILLAGIVLAAYYLYPQELTLRLANSFVLSVGSFSLQHLMLSLVAVFAGAMGGACSVLISLQHQRHLPHGFIDRKFGLRGLLLPILGGVVGMLLAFLVSLLYALLGIQASQSLLWATIPLLLAGLFGVSQDSIYGTRE